MIISTLQASIEDLNKKVQQLSRSTPDRLDKQSAITQPPKPKFAFHSVEPQAIKPRQEKDTTSESKQDSSTTPAEAPPAQLSFEDIMARSRMQGESLNQLFGSMQARSAGHQSVRLEEEEHSESNMTRQDRRGEEEEQVETQQVPPAPIGENVGNMNNYLQDAWQERLSQMGHGPESGSPYAKLRTGKIKELPLDMTGSAPGPSSGYQ